MSTTSPTDGRRRRGLAVVAGGVALLLGLLAGWWLPKGSAPAPVDGGRTAPSSEPPSGAPSLATPDRRPANRGAGAVPDEGAAPAATRPVAPRVRLRLVGADGTPVRGGHARLEGWFLRERGTPDVFGFACSDAAVVGEDGRATIEVPQGLLDPEMDVRLRRPGRAVAKGPVDLTTEAEQTVRIEPMGDARLHGVVEREDGSGVADLTLRISRGPVLEARGNDRVGGRFRLTNEGPETPFGRLGDQEVADVRTDAEGRFAVEGIAWGTYALVDAGPGWMVRTGGNLHAGSTGATVVVVPAHGGVVHVRSAADGRPVRPDRVFVEIWTGAGSSGLGPYSADLSVRWPASESGREAWARLTIEAEGFYPRRAVVRAGPERPRSETTVALRPLPGGPPGALRLSVVTSDRAFLESPFQADVHAPRPVAEDEVGAEEPDGSVTDASDLAVRRVPGRREGDTLVFDGIPPGPWRVRVFTGNAAQSLAWDADVNVPSGGDVPGTWIVPPHGAVTFGAAWPVNTWWTMTRRGPGEDAVYARMWGGAGGPVRIALPAGSWSLSWSDPDDPRTQEEMILEIEDGKDHEVPAPKAPSGPR